MKLTIKKIIGRKILDSRGNPTIEVEVHADDGKNASFGRAAAPSGASRGKFEVVDFPKGGVDKAVEKARALAPKLAKVDAFDQAAVDQELHEIDGTGNMANLGGNTTVAISMAVAKAAAAAKGQPLYIYLGGTAASELPYPLGNVIGGGKHAGGMTPDIQEYHAIAVGAKDYRSAYFATAKVHKKVGETLRITKSNFTGSKGDEGAWAPNMCNEGCMELLSTTCQEISDEVGFKIMPALDVAASSLFDAEKQVYAYKRESVMRDAGEQLDFIVDWVKKYKLFFVEDPLEEEDFAGFAELTRKVGKDCLICGDDLFVTNVARIATGMKQKSANAVLIKPNQIGTLTDTLKAVELTKKNKCTPVISHRSGETTDETIAHLAVAWGCPMIKTGVVGGERIAKLNELIRIEENLGNRAKMGKLR